MKAPDKIYIQTDMINNIPLEQQEFDDDVVYIRKDAILEWARGYKVELLDSAKTMDTDSVGKCINAGALTMLDNVIDKINSL